MQRFHYLAWVDLWDRTVRGTVVTIDEFYSVTYLSILLR